jgi:hypothetical protein
MTILGLDDRISRVSLQPMVTRATELLACHRFHLLTAFVEVLSVTFVLAVACFYALS